MKSKFKQLECLFAWSEFYANGVQLAVPTVQDKAKVLKLQKEIQKLRTQLID